MSGVMTVFRKELRSYVVGPIPYIFVALFAGILGWFFFYNSFFFVMKQASMAQFFGMMPVAMTFLVPAITMRLWSEEVRGGTIETLLTMPVRSWALVTGKFLAAWVLLLVCLVATLPIYFTVNSLGDVDGGVVLTGYLGALLLGGALLALGMWISALTRHQIVAFLLTLIAGFALFFLGHARASGALGSLFENLSTLSRYSALGRGVVDLRDVLYFASFGGFFLYLNTEAVENRRYR
jgi:ABC-2 type transport system permease protein